MPDVRTFDPSSVVVIVGPTPIGGFADGSFIRVRRTSDLFTKITGVEGVTTRVRSTDKSGEITLTLSQTSPSNDILSGYALADELANASVLPIFIKDNSGKGLLSIVQSRSLFVSAFGWVRKFPDVEYSKSEANREWLLDCSDLVMNVGGNPRER